MQKTRLTVHTMVALLLAMNAAACAQSFLTKPIRVIIPVPPGGNVDTVMRAIAPKMSETIGQSVVLETRPGASTNLGMEMAARAPGDGYTQIGRAHV